VNLFPMKGDPAHIDHRAIEYPVIADARHRELYEVHSITGAALGGPDEPERKLEPLYATRHGVQASDGAYWVATRRASSRKGENSEVAVSIVDEQFDPLGAKLSVLRLDTLATNGDLLSRIPYRDDGRDFLIWKSSVGAVHCLRKPTETLRAPLGARARWRLVSHLALNHLSLRTDLPADRPERGGEHPALHALREILKLYDFRDSPATRQRIASLIGLRTGAIVRRSGRTGFARGTEVELLIDADKQDGGSAFLFASVLEAFLGLYASINSFTETVVRSKQREGELKRWPPRAGEMPLL